MKDAMGIAIILGVLVAVRASSLWVFRAYTRNPDRPMIRNLEMIRRYVAHED